MRVISFVNLKGGVGKTVTVINTAAILDRMHSKRVLIVDADSQCNLSDFFRCEATEGVCTTLADALATAPDSGRTAMDAIYATDYDEIDIIQASDQLMGLDLTRAKSLYTDCLADLARRLRIRGEAYDYMLIDCPPAFNAASTAALIASDEVVIPIKLDAFSLRGMANLSRQIANMREINPHLRLAGLLPTMWYRGEPIRQAEEALQKSGLPVFSHIRRTPKVDAMTFFGRPLLESSPQCAAQRDYLRFVDELMKGGEQNGRV